MHPLLGTAMISLLVGADPRVVRAAMMEGLSVIAVRLGHRTEARTFPCCAPTRLDL